MEARATQIAVDKQNAVHALRARLRARFAATNVLPSPGIPLDIRMVLSGDCDRDWLMRERKLSELFHGLATI